MNECNIKITVYCCMDNWESLMAWKHFLYFLEHQLHKYFHCSGNTPEAEEIADCTEGSLENDCCCSHIDHD